MEIIYKSKNFIVINKPYGMPSQSDLSRDEDAMTAAGNMLRESGEDAALWLVHRLDRVVGGLMVFARNKNSAALLSSLISQRKLTKEYIAVVEGDCPESGDMRDYIYKDSSLSKSFIADRKRQGVKEAHLSYTALAKTETPHGIRSLVRVTLHTGRYHQIRVQFASRKMPLVGDGKYGSSDKGAPFVALFSARIAFDAGREKVDIKLNPDTGAYPWSLWSEKL